jgi:ribosomal protein L31
MIQLRSMHTNPRLFKQFLQLTDGSTIFVSSLSPNRPFIKLNMDASSHPSWNPKLRDTLLLSDHGEVAKFRNRFGSDDSDFTGAADMFDGDLRKVDSQSKTSEKAKVFRKKK